MESGQVKVWDLLVRVLHWSLVTGIALAWLTADDARRWHEAIGYVAVAVVTVRFIWGFAGPRYARFAQFVRRPRRVGRYAGQILHGTAPRYLGHNPLGGVMVLALLLTTLLVALSGWMMTTDAWFGQEWVEQVHEALATGMLGLVALHVAGVVFTGLKHGENLVRAMFSGRKRAPKAGDVT